MLNIEPILTKGKTAIDAILAIGGFKQVLAEIRKEDGSILFTQKVEVPIFWSDKAATIMASKFFINGESSIIEASYRLANTFGRWGVLDGMIKEENINIFIEEYAAALMMQYLSPNSPVWFNTGTTDSPRTSACLPGHKMILTEEGYHPIIWFKNPSNIGKLVFDGNGWTEVIAFKANGRKEIRPILLTDGSIVESTLDHLLPSKEDRHDDNYIDKQTKDIKIGHYLNKSIVEIKRRSPQKRLTKDESYILGWLLTDGYSGRSLKSTSFTVEFTAVGEDADYLREVLKRTIPSNIHYVESITKSYDCSIPVTRFRGYGKEWREYIINKFGGELGNSYTFMIPDFMFCETDENIKSFLSACFQGDGYVCTNSNTIGFSVVAKDLSYGVFILLQMLGIPSRFYYKKDNRGNRKGMWVVEIATYEGLHLFSKLIGFPTIQKQSKLDVICDRIPEKSRFYVTGSVIKRVVEILDCYSDDVYDIQTKSGYFIAEGIRYHNCYVLHVDDDMESILNLAKIEGLIFKYGSGTGTNFSTLRSYKEKLSNGGTPSGPLSFMRGYNGWAKIIKSGGITRRAARLCSLGVEHPDILDFIKSKAIEEEKARKLISLGYSGNYNDEDSAYNYVDYQTQNNSVTITDAFMQAAIKKEQWDTIAVTTGEIINTYNADDLLTEMAKATHYCGDPGYQFIDTMNKWNTCPSSGRLRGTNPCFSEDMKLLIVKDNTEQYLNMKELSKKDRVTIVRNDRSYKIGKVWKSGNKEVLEIRFHWRFGMDSLKVTSEQIIMLNNGKECEAKDLKHKKVMPYYNIKDKFDNISFLAGFIQGDGNAGRLKSEHHKGLEVYFGENDYDISAMYHQPIGRWYSNEAYNIAEQYGISSNNLPYRELPSIIIENSERTILLDNFMSGLYSANGCIIANTRISLKTTCRNLADQIKKLLITCYNIEAYITTNKKKKVKFPNGEYECRESYDINIYKYNDVLKFARYISFGQKYKRQALEQLIIKRAPYVESIKSLGNQDVYDFNILDSDNHWGVVNNIIVHNCGEYIGFDNSSCNLASINLIKFIDDKGNFDVKMFQHMIKLSILMQNIIVDRSSYPTIEITENTRKYRAVGLGWANGGALLMYLGIPYDSKEGRYILGGITSLMSSTAWSISAELGEVKIANALTSYNKGDEGDINQKALTNIIRKYKENHDDIMSEFNQLSLYSSLSQSLNEIYTVAKQQWIEVLKKKKFANTQVTLIAPTGTIGLIMDCDSTGIEPIPAMDISKLLAGGGSLNLSSSNIMLNGLLSPNVFDGNREKAAAVMKYFDEKKTLNGAPHLPKHKMKIFQTALMPRDNIISISGHINMIAIVQKFLSGGISKTVNLPADITIEEIKETIIKCWKLGIKDVALYRDGSKFFQPLKTGEVSSINTSKALSVERRRLPDNREGLIHKFSILGPHGKHSGYITIGYYPDTKEIGEFFINMGTEGSLSSGLMDVMAEISSKSLQMGVPLETIAESMLRHKFEPFGKTTNREIPLCSSVVDYVGKYLMSINEKNRDNKPKEKNIPVIVESLSKQASDEKIKLEENYKPGGPPCHVCGSETYINGHMCYKCINCGETTGCG